jgi:oligoribonuclease
MNIQHPSKTLHYVWIDLELTGLITELDDIVEFGVIGTTEDLTPLFRQKIVVHASGAAINRILDQQIVSDMMTANGLLAVLEADRARELLPTVEDAETLILAAMAEYAWRPEGNVILAGSGVVHCDLRFLKRHTPLLAAQFDVREILDVGVMRRRFQRVAGFDLTDVNTAKDHRADVDIECHRQEALAFDALFRLAQPAGVLA